jgi:hypothetical protein
MHTHTHTHTQHHSEENTGHTEKEKNKTTNQTIKIYTLVENALNDQKYKHLDIANALQA